jgi:hypothetical protein
MPAIPKTPPVSIEIRDGKQREIMEVIVRGNPDGTFCDIDQIIEKLSYSPSKASFQFSLRCILRKKLVEKEEELRFRDGARRRVIKPTLVGYRLLRGT